MELGNILYVTSEKIKAFNMSSVWLVDAKVTFWELLCFNGLSEDKQVIKLLWQVITILVV